MTIWELQREVHRLALEKGWWDDDFGNVDTQTRNIGEQFANFHAEVSEAWEEYRNLKLHEKFSDIRISATGKPEGIGIELADVVIRIMDTCEAMGIDLQTMIRIKHEYNQTRPYRHGGKRA